MVFRLQIVLLIFIFFQKVYFVNIKIEEGEELIED